MSGCALDFLTDDQVAAYERFAGDLTRPELEGFFLLNGTALDLIANKRGDHNRLGVAVQIGIVRYLGHFLTEDPLDVPWSAVECVASQLEIADPSSIKRYAERKPTAYEHSWEIRDAYGYRDFHDEQVLGRFGEFLAARAWTHAEGSLARSTTGSPGSARRSSPGPCATACTSWTRCSTSMPGHAPR